MANRMPPKHFVSSLSEEDELLSPPPPPPPPPLDTVLDNSPPTAQGKRISPPSVLRTNNSGNSKNSVAFSGIMDNLSTNSIEAATAAAALAARSRQSPNRITLDTVINSQFEDEAETHILAALEAEEHERSEGHSKLLGEGIEGMDDFSDDYSDDGGDNEQQQEQHMEFHTRNDSFLRKIAVQNDLPQYQLSAGSPNSSDSNSPQKTVQPHHQRYLSSVSAKSNSNINAVHSSRSLPSVPDDAALVMDADTDKSLAMHIQNELMEEGDDPFLEAAAAPTVAASILDNLAGGVEGDGKDGEDVIQSMRQGANKTDHEEEVTAAAVGDDVNTITDATSNTGNMNFMAQRLRSLQKRRTSLKSSRSVKSSMGSSDGSDDNPESSGDKLIDALNSVDSSKNKSICSKMSFEFKELIIPKLPKVTRNASHTLLFVIFPCLSAAAILFYLFDNPMAGKSGTSISWWILFLGVRQPLMFECTRAGEVLWVEILALRSKLFNMAVGPYISLAVIQSQGWPYIIFFWPMLDFIMLYGGHRFANHWLYWQVKLDLFNEGNPVDGVTESTLYLRILLAALFIGAAASLKRLMIAIFLGRRAVAHFGSELEKLMAKMILIGEVANLARDIENKRALFEGAMSPAMSEGDEEKLVRFREMIIDENSSTDASPSPRNFSRKTLEVPQPTSQNLSSNSASPSPRLIQRKVLDSVPGSHGSHPTPNSAGSGSVSQGGRKQYGTPGGDHGTPKSSPHDHTPTGYSPPRPAMHSSTSDTSGGAGATRADGKHVDSSSTANVKLMYLLSEWEEPELNASSNAKATVRDLVEFKKAASMMDDRYPFSHAFGHARTRDMCVKSSQEVYDRLMLSTSDVSSLPFSILSILAMDENGEFVEAKIKSLIRLFRPDRQGNLSRLDFVKSVDTVYKQLRLLRASIYNSAQIDYAFERIINCFVYFFLVIIAVAIVGIKIWTVFLSFNTFFLGFSFLFGAAASNYFEGLLLIFVRRPYDIGDRIATSNPKADTNSNGSSTWFVEKVTLFTTTVRYATTNEVATYSNGSLAVLRIINANRSTKAIVSILIKFGLETPFNKITVFRTAVENFIKARPREWIALAGFRATRVEADFGYVEYKIIAQHRESWQNIGPVLQSKADLSSFCLEATKKLNMKYESPPMPVNLSTTGSLDLSGMFHEEDNTTKSGNIGEGKSQNFSAEDLQDVANLFEIRKKKKT